MLCWQDYVNSKHSPSYGTHSVSWFFENTANCFWKWKVNLRQKNLTLKLKKKYVNFNEVIWDSSGTQRHCHSLSSLHNLKFRLNTGRQCTGNEGSILTAHSLMFPRGVRVRRHPGPGDLSISLLFIYIHFCKFKMRLRSNLRWNWCKFYGYRLGCVVLYHPSGLMMCSRIPPISFGSSGGELGSELPGGVMWRCVVLLVPRWCTVDLFVVPLSWVVLWCSVENTKEVPLLKFCVFWWRTLGVYGTTIYSWCSGFVL